MSDGLIAPVESSRQAWAGSGLTGSIEGLADAIKTEDWVDDALAGASLGLEVASTVMHPISALLAKGFGWARECFEPLRDVLDELTGMPDMVRSHAATWNNMADELYRMSADLDKQVKENMPDWRGAATDAYRGLMANNVEAIGGLACPGSERDSDVLVAAPVDQGRF